MIQVYVKELYNPSPRQEKEGSDGVGLAIPNILGTYIVCTGRLPYASNLILFGSHL